MKSPVIYKIRNVTNGKFYVGSTGDMRERFRAHRNRLRRGKHTSWHLQAAWNKYGEECFVFEVVERVERLQDLQAVEDRWLVEHVGKEHCYNIGLRSDAPWRGVAPGMAHPNMSKPRTTEQRAQISATLKDYYKDHPGPRLGALHTLEARAKMSASSMGVNAGAEHYRYGKTLSPEVRKKIGDAQRGIPKAPRTISAEGRAKIAAAAAAGHYSHWTGRTHTPEARAKLSKPIKELTTGQTFPSLTAALGRYGLHMPTLLRAIRSGKPLAKGPNEGLRFAYLTPPPQGSTSLSVAPEL